MTHEATAEALQSYRKIVGRDGNDLIDFANRHAIDASLRHKAVMLQLSFNEASSDASRAESLEEIRELVAQIRQDRREASAEALDEFAQRRAYLERQSGVDIDGNVVFRGRGLSYDYPDGKFRLSDVDLCLEEGQITGVVGENANGKTTLFRIVAGLLRQTDGTLDYPLLNGGEGRKIQWGRVKEKIAYLPQELTPLYGTMEENLRYTASVHGQVGKDNDLAVGHIVTRLHLGEYLDRKWGELAGGYKLRFSLARALVSKPKLLVLDEPLANLDFVSQLTVLRDIRDLARSFRDPIAVLISSQHLHEIEAVADRILYLRKGRVAFNGPIEEIGADSGQYVFELGTKMDMAALQAKLPMQDIVAMTYNGLSYVIKTRPVLTPQTFLTLLLEQDVRIDYFRDISHSVKQLFESEALASNEIRP